MLEPVCEGVWIDADPVRFLRLRLTATMTVLRLTDRTLLVCSPIALTPERRAQVDALGTVAHVYAPNTFHHLHAGEWANAYPAARVHAPPGLAKKRRDLRIDRVHGSTPEPAFEDVVDELRIDGFRMQETVLFHRPSSTLVVADLLHNIGRPRHWWTRLYTRAMGFYDRVGLSRFIRSTAFPDRVAARRSLDLVLACPIERVIVGHGAPVVEDARGALERTYAWLPPARRELRSGVPAACG
jgi:hypothetical protein